MIMATKEEGKKTDDGPSPYDMLPTHQMPENSDVINVEPPTEPAADANPVETTENGLERAVWSQKIEFILTCVGYAVGLGNIWRFPYLCHKNGGGAFLVPYAIMLSCIGLPIFFFELAFGQFASLGPISIWTISPLFKGLGMVMVVISAFFSVYYIVIVSYCVYFMFASFTSKLPWEDCDRSWAAPDCVSIMNRTLRKDSLANQTSTYQFFNFFLLGKSSSMTDFGAPNWRLVLSFLFAWLLVCIVLIKGIQSLGKAGYITATFPYVILTVLLVRSATLPGSLQGVVYYLKPRKDGLLKLEAWTDAATQIFFSLSTCFGGLIAMSSFNKFNNNCLRDAILVALVNCGTSIYAGFVIFSTLGFMAKISEKSVENVAEAGFNLAFIVYPEILSQLPVAQLWSFLFFFMMALLGFGSEFCIVETVLAAVQDELRRLKILTNNIREIIFRLVICAVFLLLGLPMVCRGGIFLLDMVDTEVCSGYPMLTTALLELIVIIYIYGIDRFCEDIRLMIGVRPNIYWRVTWAYISPVLLSILLLIHFIDRTLHSESKFNKLKGFPFAMQIACGIVTILPLPAYFLYKYCKEGGFILLQEFFKPLSEWGPVQKEHRDQFLETIKQNAGANKDDEEFFQSKQSIVNKIADIAQKEQESQSPAIA